MNARRIFSLLIIALFFYVASPLLIPVAFGAIFAVLFFPAFEYLVRRRMASSLASALITLGVTLVFLLPASFLIFMGAKAGLEQVRALKVATPVSSIPAEGGFFDNLVNTPGLHNFLERVTRWFPIEVEELTETASELARGVSLRLADYLGEFITRLPVMVMGMVIMILSIYFFLVDGRKLVSVVRVNSFYDAHQTERMIHSFAGMCRSVILATVVSGFIQSLIFCVAAISVGLHEIVLIGFLVFLCSFIPLIGSAPVTFGIAVHQLVVNDHKSVGVILLIVAAIVAVMDNFIRPMVLKGSANLHPLLAFVAAFGGLQVFGFAGVFLGPIIAGLFVVTVENLLHGKV